MLLLKPGIVVIFQLFPCGDGAPLMQLGHPVVRVAWPGSGLPVAGSGPGYWPVAARVPCSEGNFSGSEQTPVANETVAQIARKPRVTLRATQHVQTRRDPAPLTRAAEFGPGR